MRSSIESAAMLLRIDQIVSGVSHQKALRQAEDSRIARPKVFVGKFTKTHAIKPLTNA